MPESLFGMLLLCFCTYLGLGQFVAGSNSGYLLDLSAVLAVFTGVSTVHWYYRERRWVAYSRSACILILISFLYTYLAVLAFDTVPWNADGSLFALDRAIGMERLHLRIAPALTTQIWFTELLSVAYSLFIPYLAISVLQITQYKNTALRDLFFTALATLYCIGFLGYLFIPAQGPIVALAEQIGANINGGFFHALVTGSVNKAGGPHGAFPSIHVAASVLIFLFDFKHGSRERAWIYLPLIILIAIATVALRYHYVVDLMAGILLALFSLLFANRLYRKQRVRAVAHHTKNVEHCAKEPLYPADNNVSRAARHENALIRHSDWEHQREV